MGNVTATLHATGSHHNGLFNDLDVIFARFVKEVEAAGHHVHLAVLTHGEAEVHGGADGSSNPLLPAAPVTPTGAQTVSTASTTTLTFSGNHFEGCTIEPAPADPAPEQPDAPATS